MTIRLTNIRLLVAEFADCFRFYRDVLGFQVIWSDEAAGYAEFETGTLPIALFDRSRMAETIGTSHLPGYVSCQDRTALIFSVENVDKAYESLVAKGVIFTTLPTDRPAWGVRTAHFRDPAGNLIEINAPL